MPAEFPVPRIPFVVGVYGDTDLGNHETAIRAAVRRIFEHLSRPRHDEPSDLGPGFGLVNSPIRLLTSLAPGADAVVAEVAKDVLCSRLEVVVPLPFPVEIGPNATMPPWWGSMTSARATEWDAYRARFEDAGSFVVRLAADDDDGTQLRTDLADPARWGARFRAAAEYVSAYSGLLIVVSRGGVEAVPWDESWSALGPAGSGSPPHPVWVPVHDPGWTGPGGRPAPEEVLLCKLRGTTLFLTSRDVAFTWADAGMAFHVAADAKGTVTALHPIDTRPAEVPVTVRTHHAGVPLANHLCPDPKADTGKSWAEQRAAEVADDVSNLGRLQEQAEKYRDWVPWGRFGWLGDRVARQVDASLAEDRPAPRSVWERAGRIGQRLLRCVVGRPYKWVKDEHDEYQGRWVLDEWPRFGGRVDLWGHLLGRRSAPVDAGREPGEAASMFRTTPAPGPDPAATAAAVAELTDVVKGARMVALCAARRRAANLSNNLLSGEWTRLLAWLFVFAFLSAVSLHAAAHWQVPENKDDDHATHVARGVRTGLAGFAVALVVFNGVWLARYWLSRHEQFRFDFRALAEGLRVQAYWAAAGLDRSVSANYLQRQREGLGWIRRAVSALAAPYSEWRRRWTELGGGSEITRLKVQVGLLAVVQQKWVQEQLAYGSKKAAELHALREMCHPIGYGLAVTGVVQVVPWLLWPHGDPAPLPAWCVWLGLAVAGVFLVAAGVGCCRTRDRNAHDDFHAHDPHAAPRPVRWVRRTGVWQRWVANGLIGCRWSYQWLHHGTTRYVPRRRRWPAWAVVVRSVLGYLVLAAVLQVPLYAACVGLGQCFPWVPEAGTLWEIAFGTNLIAGAMAVAWVEKRLVAEELHQYQAMTRTYRAADIRLTGHLAAARVALRQADAKLAAGEVAKDELAETGRRVKAVQELLYQVGLQALDESAEWLLLHRARPIEPVMAG